MKKLSIVLVILAVVCSCVFAAGPSIKLSAGYETLSTKVLTANNAKKTDAKAFKAVGLSVDFGADYAVTDTISVYGGIGFAFPTKYKLGTEAKNKDDLQKTAKTINSKATVSMLDFHANAGAAFNVNSVVDLPVDVLAGAGLAIDSFACNTKYDSKNSSKFSVLDLGLDIHVEAAYEVIDNLSVALILDPTFMLYNNYKVKVVEDSKKVSADSVNKGHIAFGFQFLGGIGAKYSF